MTIARDQAERSPVVAQTQDELVRQCAISVLHGGAGQISRLVDATSRRTVRFSMSILGHREDAEDAVQQVLIKVATDPSKLAAVAHPWSYLLGMVRNESLMILRRRRPWVGLVDCFTGALSWHIDPVVAKQRHVDVWKALEKLPRNQREVVVLKIWEGFTFAEIGEVLSISLATAASRYRYALKKLAGSLDAWDPNERTDPASADAGDLATQATPAVGKTLFGGRVQ